ncbi:MAG: hypothetical protein LBK72_03660 [Bifidobacteriaceae bacterium]|nr:hypothetical protein [Bifidobacteriaceae bacterium]
MPMSHSQAPANRRDPLTSGVRLHNLVYLVLWQGATPGGRRDTGQAGVAGDCVYADAATLGEDHGGHPGGVLVHHIAGHLVRPGDTGFAGVGPHCAFVGPVGGGQ